MSKTIPENNSQYCKLCKAAIFFALLLVFFRLSLQVVSGKPFAWDPTIMWFIHAYSRPGLDQLMLVITYTGSEFTPIIFTGTLLWLYRNKAMDYFWGAAASFLGAISTNGLAKMFFARPRPLEFPALTTARTFSFPSGHTVAAVSLYGYLAYLLWKKGSRGWAVLLAGWILPVGISRIYLGVHYPSDVIGGLIFGGIWLIGVIYWISKPKSNRGGSRCCSRVG